MKWLRLIISIAIPLTTGSIAGIVTSKNVNTWYPQLNKPSFNPPNWLFGPVWTILYVMMGISLYLLWTKAAKRSLPSAFPDQPFSLGGQLATISKQSATSLDQLFAPDNQSSIPSVITDTTKRNVIILFFIQLALNFIWSFLFFEWHLIGWALVDICLLWLLIITCLVTFPKISKPAAWLFIPYLLWVSFATLLNAAIYILN